MNNKTATPDDVDSVLHSWVSGQLKFWEEQTAPLPPAGEFFKRLNDSRSDVFVFVIRDQRVSILPKPKHYTADDFEQGTIEVIKRALQYRLLFTEVARDFSPDLACQLAMSTDDMAMESSVIPLFAFQKQRGSHAVLLPDIDALNYHFYAGSYTDGIAYDQTIDKAVFVGSTTGEMHTLASVRELKNERLKLGVFYRDNPDVIFNLPNITQCDSPETEAAIRALGFGTGAMNWAEQLTYRFLLSVDGNGATCSRVAIALKSNSVLLKFNSDHVLYYFDGLEAGRNFLAISAPEEVQTIIDAERLAPGTHQPVAQAGTAFYQNFLTREPTMRYTARLLERYAALFPEDAEQLRHPDEPAVPDSTRAAGHSASDVKARCIAHIRDQGDVAFDLDSWIGDIHGESALEGFEIDFQSGIATGSLNCKILTNKDASWIQQSNDVFVGSRSRSSAIIGLAFDLLGVAAGRYDCLYTCAFADGTLSPTYANGEPCQSDDTRPITAFQLSFPYKKDRSGNAVTA